MYAAGGRVFIQMGTGSLAGSLGIPQGDPPRCSESTGMTGAPALEQISRILSALCVCGYGVDPSQGWTRDHHRLCRPELPFV